MTRKSNNDSLNRINPLTNYCVKCWVDFITLTEEEKQNLKQIKYGNVSKKRKTPLFT
jgi:hypothetical protein